MEWCKIKLIDYFFILLIINSFIFFYSLYTFFDMKLFHNLQGAKLKMKTTQPKNRRWFFIKRIFFTLFVMSVLCFLGYLIFSPLYTTNSIIVDYGLHTFDICTEQPIIWKYCKIWFCFTYLFSSFFIANLLSHIFHSLFQFQIFPHKKLKKRKKTSPQYSFINLVSQAPLQLLIGENKQTHELLYLPEKSLYQNILITGTIPIELSFLRTSFILNTPHFYFY